MSQKGEIIGCKVKIVEPGMIKTVFGGRSLDFFNNENLTEYQKLVGKLFQSMEAFTQYASEPSVFAEVIYEAITDGTDQLRYITGEDAKRLMENRKKFSNAKFISSIKSQMGL